MSATKIGVPFVRGHIKKEIDPITIVVVDVACWDEHKAIKGKFSHLYELESNRQWRHQDADESTDPASHGTACIATVKCNKPLDPGYEEFWNIAPEANVLFAQIPKPNFDDDPVDHATPILETLLLLIKAAEKRKLVPGDVVAIPLGLWREEKFEHGVWHPKLATEPIIVDDLVELAIQKLTCVFGILVVIAAGNSGTDLEEFSRHISHPDKPINPSTSIFSNRGVDCGAIIAGGVDAEHAIKEHLTDNVSNYGRAVDAYSPDSHDDFVLRYYGERWPLDQVKSSSGATMWVAANLANMQHLRMSNDWDVYKPYEARAHLRQWTKRRVVNEKIDLSIPNLKKWTNGTALFAAKRFDDE